MEHALLGRVRPIVDREMKNPQPHNFVNRLVSSIYFPSVVMLLGVALIFELNAQYCILYCPVQSTPDQNHAAILENLYHSMIFAIFLGGWVTGMISVSVGGTLIAKEFDRHTWDLFATTPFTNREIVFGKFTAGMWQMRSWLLSQLLLRGLFLLFALGLLLTSTAPFDPEDLLQVRQGFAEAPAEAITFSIVLTFFILLQPLLTSAAGIALGIFCSTLTDSEAWARKIAMVARLMLWVFAWALLLGLYIGAQQSHPYETSLISSPWQLAPNFFAATAHMYELSHLIGKIHLIGESGLAVIGLLSSAALGFIVTWFFLRLATSSLIRRRL